VIRIEATVDADQATDAFKHARRDIYRRTKSGIKHAGERTILPKARRGVTRRTPVVASQLIVKTTTTDGYLTARTVKQGRKIGLLNFGGTVDAPIVPKAAQKKIAATGTRGGAYKGEIGGRKFNFRGKRAIAFGGIVVSQVNKARRYRGSHFLEKARDEGLEEFGQALLPSILMAFEPLEHTP
jgi:hypothetical protein